MKYDCKKHKFAVIKDGFSLYGVGKTKTAAMRDAANWLETKEKPQGTCTIYDVKKLLDHGKEFNIHGEFYLITDADEIKQYVESI